MNNKKMNELLIVLGKTTLEIYEYKKMQEKLDSDYKEAMEYLDMPNVCDSVIEQLEQRKGILIDEIIKERVTNE